MAEFEYTNIYRDRFLEPFREIFRMEMRSIKMYMDDEYKERGTKWLNLVPLPEIGNSMRSMGQIRDYSATLRYYQFYKPERNRIWYKVITDMGEKIKRLIGNHSNFTVKGTWVNENGTWGETSTVWSVDRDTYCWHNMMVDIDYNPDRSELEEAEGKKLAIIEFPITFSHEEVYD